jgi:LysM repeat protein
MLRLDKRFLLCMAPVIVVHLFALVSINVFFKPAQPVTSVEAPAERGDEPLPDADNPVSTPSAPEGALPQQHLHQVVSGDSYWSIAHKYGVSVNALLAYNGHERDRVLQINEILKIPDR